MIDAVFQLLFRYESAISEKQVCQALGITKYQDYEKLKNIFESDDRFVPISDKLWKIAPLQTFLEDKALKEVIFVITDIETTGSIRGEDRIIDLAALKVRNGEVIGEFNTLVNPEKSISYPIARLTGISNKMVANAPIIEQALPDFVEFAGSGIFVAHNALFDFHFINSEIRRLDVKPLQNRVEVCSFRLAKKLLREAKSHGVVGLSQYFNYKIENHHRAMSDVLATKYFFDRLLELLEKRNVTTLFQLVEIQKEKITKKKLRKTISRFHKNRKHLPDKRKSLPNR